MNVERKGHGVDLIAAVEMLRFSCLAHTQEMFFFYSVYGTT